MTDDAVFKAHLDAARTETPQMDAAFMDRLISDAMAAQDALIAPPPVAPPVTRPAPGIWQQIREGLGGWPGLGGLVAASLVGIWFGAAPPSAGIGIDPAALVFGQVETYDDLFQTVAMPASFAEN